MLHSIVDKAEMNGHTSATFDLGVTVPPAMSEWATKHVKTEIAERKVIVYQVRC